MREVMRGPLDASGKPIYRSFPYDSGFAQGWRAIHLGTSPTAVSNGMEATMGLDTLVSLADTARSGSQPAHVQLPESPGSSGADGRNE